MTPKVPMTSQNASATNARVAAVVFFASFIGLIMVFLSGAGFLHDTEGAALVAIVYFGPLIAVAFLFSAVGWAISRPLAKWALPLLSSRHEPTTAARILCVLLSVAVAAIGVIALVLSSPANFANITTFFALGAWPLLAATFALLLAWFRIKHVDQDGGA
jgi:hypothetical protein